MFSGNIFRKTHCWFFQTLEIFTKIFHRDLVKVKGEYKIQLPSKKDFLWKNLTFSVSSTYMAKNFTKQKQILNKTKGLTPTSPICNNYIFYIKTKIYIKSFDSFSYITFLFFAYTLYKLNAMFSTNFSWRTQDQGITPRIGVIKHQN